MDWIVALVALTAMEIVLGIDNIVFISILAGRLPKEQQETARRLGLGVALATRILLLLAIKWVLGLTAPIFNLQSLGFRPEWFGEHGSDLLTISWRDVIMLGGGLFLIGHSVREIHDQFEPHTKHRDPKVHSMASVVIQIGLMDLIFSLDSVITAVGMVHESQVPVMIAAITMAMIVMLVAAGPISRFVERHPTIKVLALSFLILIGVMLVAEGLGQQINKGYIYFAMAFSLVVEMINMRIRPLSLVQHPQAGVSQDPIADEAG